MTQPRCDGVGRYRICWRCADIDRRAEIAGGAASPGWRGGSGRNSLAIAIAEYEQCLSLIGPTPDGTGQDEAELLTALGRCYWNLSEARTAWRTLRRAISLYQERDDGVGKARATVEILRIWGPPERHLKMAEDALQSLGDAEPYLRARLLLGLRWLDDSPDEKYEQAIALGEQHGFEDIVVTRVEREAWQAFEEGRIDDGTALLLDAHETHARPRAFPRYRAVRSRPCEAASAYGSDS